MEELLWELIEQHLTSRSGAEFCCLLHATRYSWGQTKSLISPACCSWPGGHRGCHSPATEEDEAGGQFCTAGVQCLLWPQKIFLYKEKKSPHRGTSLSLLPILCKENLIRVFIYFKARNGYYNRVAELHQNCYVMNILLFITQLKTCILGKQLQWKEAVFRLSPKLQVFPAEVQITIPPPTSKWPLALKI